MVLYKWLRPQLPVKPRQYLLCWYPLHHVQKPLIDNVYRGHEKTHKGQYQIYKRKLDRRSSKQKSTQGDSTIVKINNIKKLSFKRYTSRRIVRGEPVNK